VWMNIWTQTRNDGTVAATLDFTALHCVILYFVICTLHLYTRLCYVVQFCILNCRILYSTVFQLFFMEHCNHLCYSVNNTYYKTDVICISNCLMMVEVQ